MADGCRFLESYTSGACGSDVEGETDAGVPMCGRHLDLVEEIGPVVERDADGSPVADKDGVTA